MRIIFLFFLFSTINSGKIFSQTVTIEGSESVNPSSQEYYEAYFDYTLNPYTNITWSVSGGTIISQSYSVSGTIWCIVEWNNSPCAGNISIYEDLGTGYCDKSIDIGNYNLIQTIMSTPSTRTAISCTPITTTGCNPILNNNFTPLSTYDYTDPFTNNHVPNWTSTHGTPQITDGIYPTLTPPSPATGFAFMYAHNSSNGIARGEGITQKVKPFVVGTTYRFSFFKRFSLLPVSGAAQLDHFYICLIKCSDFNLFPTGTDVIPAFPTNSQIIYHEIAMTNQSWAEVSFTFVANDTYDMIWIFPKQESEAAAFVNFAFPTINSLLISPNETVSVCTPWEYAPTNSILLTSSPTISGQYQWYKDGQAISGATSQTHNAQHYQQGNNIRTHIYTVKDLANQCESPSVTVKFVPKPLPPVDGSGSFFKEQWYTIRTTENIAPATYTWNIPGATVSDVDINDPYIDILFPNASPNTINATVTINGQSACANGTYNYQFLSRTEKFSSKNVEVKETISLKNKKTAIYPIPASSNVTFDSPLPILGIEIYNSSMVQIKTIGNINVNKVTIMVNDLKPGIYFCKLHNYTGTEVLKLVIH